MSDSSVGPAHDLAKILKEVRDVLIPNPNDEIVDIVDAAKAVMSQLKTAERLRDHHRLESDLRGVEIDKANEQLADAKGKTIEAMHRAKAIMEHHLDPKEVPPGTGVKELAEMLVAKNIACCNIVVKATGIKGEGYPELKDIIRALVWGCDTDKPEALQLVKLIGLHEKTIGLHEKTIADLKQKVADLEALAEERRKRGVKWAAQWLDEVTERCELDEEFAAIMRPGLQQIYTKLAVQRRGSGPR